MVRVPHHDPEHSRRVRVEDRSRARQEVWGEPRAIGWSGKKLNLMGYVGPITLSLENLDNSADVVLSRRL